MGLYDDLIPNKGGSSSPSNSPTKPEQGKYGIYSDLVTTSPKPATTEKPGIFQSVKNFFTGDKTETPTPAPSPAPSSVGIYQDLLPAPKQAEPTKPSFLDKAGAVVGKALDTASKGITKITETPAKGKTTLDFLPSEFFRHLPLGIGATLSQIQDDPETAAKITLGDAVKEVPGAVVDTGKEILKGLIAGGLNVGGLAGALGTGGKFNGQIHFNIPGLGEVSNNQFNAASRVAAGEDPLLVSLEEGSASIFNTLFFVDIAARPFLGRPTKVAEFKTNANKVPTVDNALPPGAPEIVPGGTKIRGQIDYGPKSFRLYTPPEVTRPLTPQAVSLMEQQGIDLGPSFNPNLPTYFRVTGGKGGSITGEVIQVKPSYFDLFKNKVFSKADQVEYFRKTVAQSQGVDVDRAIAAGDMPREAFYKGSGKVLSDRYAAGRIDDIAQKLDEFRPGLGDQFRKSVDVSNSTMEGLVAKGEEILNKSLPAKSVPSPEVTKQIIAGELMTGKTPPSDIEVLHSKTVDLKAAEEASKTPRIELKPTEQPEGQKPIVTPRGTVFPPEPKGTIFDDLIPKKETDLVAEEVRKKANTVFKLMGNELGDINIIGSTARGKEKPNDLDILITPKNKLPELTSTTLHSRIELQNTFKDELQPLFPDKKIHVTISEYSPERGPKISVDEFVKKQLPPEQKPTIDLGPTEKQISDDIANKEASIRALYKSAGQSKDFPEFAKADEELSRLITEMELSRPGERIFDEGETRGVSSTFPEWVPEHLRSTELFQKVMGPLQSLENIKYPEGNRPKQRALYDAILSTLDTQLGVDTSQLRSAIIKGHGKLTEQRKNAKVGSGGARGGEISREGTQRERVAKAVEEGPKSIKQVAEETQILEPNVRRILGVGAKDGTFERIDKGVYVLKNNGQEVAWIEAGDAKEVLARMADEGKKFDMIFLDPAYFSRALIGGNRGIKAYDFILPEEFKKVMGSVSKLVRTPDTHVYLMLSGARTAQSDMLKYAVAAEENGFKVVGEGGYQKLFKDGSPVTNVRGEVAQPERIILYTQSGEAKKGDIPISLQFRFLRPSIKTSYATEKPAELLKALIEQSTIEGESVLDPFAGSGVTGAEAIRAGRKPTLVEKRPEVVEEVIKPRLEKINEEATKKEQDATSKGGTTFASVGKFRDDTPINLGAGDKVKAIELPEMIDIARELMGQVPKIRQKVSRAFGGEARGVFIPKGSGEIRLRADLFDPTKNDVGQAAKTLAHEIGHLTDYLPNLTMSRGNLMGRLLTLKNFGKDYIEEAGISRSNSAIKTELWALSKYWKPVDEATASSAFLEYRKSSKEVYADFISVLFNNPKLAADMAPEAYNLFFAQLDKKPAVKDAYFEVQSLLSGDRIELIKARRKGVQQMFNEGDYKAIELQNEKMKEREKRNNDLVFKTKFELIDKNFALIDRVNELEKKGVFINPDDNPVYYLEERNYLGGKIKAIMETSFNPIYQDLTKAGITWNDFGEALFYQRIIAGDRSAQANPRGITVDAANELHSALVKSLTPEQGPVLADSIVRFREQLKTIAEEAYNEGLYTPELYKQMQENPAYVTFQVIDHLEEGMSSKVYKSIGTLKDITNPADASILKMIATVRAIERNKVTRTSVDFLKQHFPNEIEDAKKVFNGKNGTRFIDSRQPYNDTVIFYRGGKAEGYYVDSYIKKAIDNESVGQTFAIVSGLRFLNSHLYRPLFIGFNLGFQSFNFVRDFKRFYKNIPDMTLLRAMERYHEAYPLARTRAFGPKTDKEGNVLAEYKKAVSELTQLEHDRVFSVTFNDILQGENEEDTQIERILRTSGIDSFQDPKVKNAALKPFVHVLEFIKRLGDLIETLPKAAGFYEVSSKKPLTKEDTSYIRKNIGSPDFLAGGHLKPATNEIFLFSNAITQGVRSDFNMATNPKTRSGYWWKTAKLDIIPKLLMLAGGIGLFGAEIKKIMEDASEYDKTNYTIIPLGTDTTGKSIYFRFPSDEGGRLIGGLFWKIINVANNEQPITTDLANIASFTGGQIPSISPTITILGATAEFLSGQNPYDSFRGRSVLSESVFEAGGWRANKAFLGWLFNQVGGGIFYRFTSEQAVPREMGTAEKVFNLPVLNNVVGRFFRVTDYGTQEQLNKIKENVRQERANELLNEIDATNEIMKKAQEDPNIGVNFNKYKKELVEGYLGHAPKSAEEIETAKRLTDRLRVSLQKGGGGAEVNALINTRSNDEKIEVIRKIKETLPDDEFQAFKKSVIDSRITTSEVFHKAIK